MVVKSSFFQHQTFRIHLLILFSCFCLFIPSITGQNTPKEVSAVRMSEGMKIIPDGIVDEDAWKKCTPAGDFITYEPEFGKSPSQQTEVCFLYNDYGLYVGLKMTDSAPDSIYHDLSVRDDEGNSEWIALMLSPSNDGQNGFLFEVTAAGVQIDSKIIMDGSDDDIGWDAVWYSGTSINPEGWSAEFLIPWSALRFPNAEVQSWDMNLMRAVRRTRETSTWSPVDRKKHGTLTQSGKLTGLNGIHTPVRLALMPYGSAYLQKTTHVAEPSYTFNAGMDLKYGILNNYTLDLTMIPDFGQVKSDDEIYNFSPFEVQYNENRPFFTEGTELFTKAGIFYSRRIGKIPSGYDDVYLQIKTGDSLLTNPAETQLINATKFSGRDDHGFATGIFNAMTKATYASIIDSAGNQRDILTQPFTNYNMVVLDQSLKNNSYVHLANTNTSYSGYIGNVTASSFRLIDRKQKYALSGLGAYSHLHSSGNDPNNGHRFGFTFSRISGNLRWSLTYNAISKDYNPNDMGYLTETNVATISGSASYYQFQPVRNMLQSYLVLNSHYCMLYEGSVRRYLQFNFSGNTTFRNHLSLGANIEVVPGNMRDYYEARTPGRVYVTPGFIYANFWLSPDYRKKFLIDLNGGTWLSKGRFQKGYEARVAPRLRINARSLLILSLSVNVETPSVGFSDIVNIADSTMIIFGKRNVNTITTSLSTEYIVNPVSSFSLRVRHYWVTTDYLQFYTLNNEGTLDQTGAPDNYNFTLNIFNIDLNYSWNFAPGSFLNIMYKQALKQHIDDKIEQHYIRNWESMLESPVSNSISVKLIYYIDYENIRRKTFNYKK
jgi:hypothetical protein